MHIVVVAPAAPAFSEEDSRILRSVSGGESHEALSRDPLRTARSFTTALPCDLVYFRQEGKLAVRHSKVWIRTHEGIR